MSRTRPLFSCLAALFVLVACADQPTRIEHDPGADARGPSLSQAAPSEKLAVLATFRTRREITIAWAKKWIGAEGGRLDFQGFSVVVPAGAVQKVTQFSIHLPVDPQGSERVVAEFGPHGAKFAQPITLGFPLRGTSIEASPSPTVLWWSGSGWVDMGGSAAADGSQLFTTTDHFSEFGSAEGQRSGGVILSGG